MCDTDKGLFLNLSSTFWSQTCTYLCCGCCGFCLTLCLDTKCLLLCCLSSQLSNLKLLLCLSHLDCLNLLLLPLSFLSLCLTLLSNQDCLLNSLKRFGLSGYDCKVSLLLRINLVLSSLIILDVSN